jgi:hypothetical protein
MTRNYRKTTEWKNNPKRQPLLLFGARQVGKTYVINDFGNHFDNIIYVNLEVNVSVAADFNNDISPKSIINRLEIFYKEKVIPGKTLIFFDEIQSCDRALTSLKYFSEDAPEYHIAAAGSLLSLSMGKHSFL